jgi:hypothetical protein
VQQFLGSASGAVRSAHQKAATIVVFNALHQIPRFRLYLSSQAATNPQFSTLQSFLTDPSNSSGTLSRRASADVIRAADTYTRHYLLAFIGHPGGGNPRFRQELDLLPNIRQRMANLQRSRSSRSGSADERRALMLLQLSPPMDADTLTAAVLYIRRYTLAHPSRGRGRAQDRISVWQAPAQREATPAAVPAATPSQPTRTPLQEFAHRNWSNLTTEMYSATHEGRPQALITLMRNLPEGQSSFERTLRSLGRDDVPRTFDRLFNNYLHRDRAFLAFARSRSAYTGVARASTELSASSSAADRRLVTRAVQDFINFTAGRSDEPWCSRLSQDLRMLYRQVLRPPIRRDNLQVNGTADMRTISALAVYTWRKANRTSAVGHWARSLGVTPPQQETAPARPRREGERRRVIRF